MKKENVENMIPARCLKEALVTWPLSASGLLKKGINLVPRVLSYPPYVGRVGENPGNEVDKV